MTSYVKINEKGVLEYAPVNKPGISNWINNLASVYTEGYLPLKETAMPDDGKIYTHSYKQEKDKIVEVWTEYSPAKEDLPLIQRQKRDDLIDSIDWRIDRYKEQKELSIETNDNAQMYKFMLLYKQYLRDIPESVYFPDVEILDFDKWYEKEIKFFNLLTEDVDNSDESDNIFKEVLNEE